ncbi:Lsr2 family protein [Actinosynnema sp. NPDC023794]
MARKVVTLDDLDGISEAAETILYLCDGQYLEVDLSGENAAKFRKVLAPYIAVSRTVPAKEAGRRVLSNGSTQTAVNATVLDEIDPAIVRAWAIENGHEISDKGRVPQNIVEAWRQAQVATSAS